MGEMVRLSVSAALPGVRPDLCGWHLCRLQKKTFCDHRRFLYEMWETAGGYTAGILPGLQQKAACIPAKSCAAVLSGTGKIVIVSDEICKPSGLCRNLRQGNGVRLGPWIRRCKITRIIPVPLHRKRQRKRGYNQAAVIAKSMGRELHLPVDEKTLFRVRNTVPQKALNDRERRRNLSGAFQIRKGAELPEGECVLLIDDIYTTGSTLDAAALCLRQSTKCTVYAASIAIGG